MEETQTDDIGRMFCKKHHRETCHMCCFCFEPMNRDAEERAGLRKPKTKVEILADNQALAETALRGMECMMPRPPKAVFEQNRQFLSDAQKALKAFPASEVAVALQKAREKHHAGEIEQRGLLQGLSKKNPGKTTFELGGQETQQLVDELLSKPVAKSKKAEYFTCGYCRKASPVGLLQCGRCMKVAYCGKDCQKSAWKAHKKECVPWTKEKEPKIQHLTWDQVSAHDGAPVMGLTLEVRAVLDESVMRQVFSCKDREGVVRRVAAYTDSRKIPGLKQGSILRWKNPRYHYFMDGSSGARIEEEDLVDITVL